MNSILWILFSLVAIQMLIAAIITKKNNPLLNKYPAHQFKKAVNELKKENPLQAKTLTLMYGLLPLEYIIAQVISEIK